MKITNDKNRLIPEYAYLGEVRLVDIIPQKLFVGFRYNLMYSTGEITDLKYEYEIDSYLNADEKLLHHDSDTRIRIVKPYLGKVANGYWKKHLLVYTKDAVEKRYLQRINNTTILNESNKS